MRKKIVAILLSALMAFGCLACKEQSTATPIGEPGSASAETTNSATNKDTSTLFINLSSEPEYLDPTLNTTLDGVSLAVNSFAGLYTYNQEEQIVPAIATSNPVISEDGLTYTISMNNTKWSNGDAVTAGDFVYSWNRAIMPETGADYATLFDVIARKDDGTLDVEALDDLTLEIHMQSPCPYFMSLLAFPAFYPVHRASVEAANPAGNTPEAWTWEAGFVSNGAYTLQEWKHDEYLLYVKNPYYYDAANVNMEKLYFMLTSDDAVSYTAYELGDLDFVDQIPAAEVELLLSNREFHIADRLSVHYLAFNVNAPLFDDMTVEQAKDFRKAVSLLIDRSYIVDTITQTGQVAADSYVPTGMSDGNGGVFKTDSISYYDAKETGIQMDKEATSLLEGCGYTFTQNNDGTYSCSPAIQIPLLVNTTDVNLKIANSVATDLQQLGIEVTIEETDKNDMYARQERGDFVFSRGNWTADFDDPVNMLQCFVSGLGVNTPMLGFGDSYEELNWGTYDDLIHEINTTTDYEHRVEVMHQAEDMLMDTWAVIPLYYDNDVYMQKSNVEGIYVTSTGCKYFMYATKQ
ncbi:MAG: peptide ABC transporter substrate-binding protein [Lachnospiraceae bacterium]|nr:peptide ABC transporter substrate-binding protein [Lachnospiraceae bacterium]